MANTDNGRASEAIRVERGHSLYQKKQTEYNKQLRPELVTPL